MSTTQASELPPLPEQCQELTAYWECDTCAGHGVIDGPMYMGEFQSPECPRCPDCEGNGRVKCSAFIEEQMRSYGQACAALATLKDQGEATGYVNLKYGFFFTAAQYASTERNKELLESGEVIRVFSAPADQNTLKNADSVDAARYRWLTYADWIDDAIMEQRGIKAGISETLDSAIDSAIAAMAAHEGSN